MNLLLLAVGQPLLQGAGASDAFGTALAGGVDLDGDGYSDLAVGAPGVDGRGAVYVYGGDGSTLALSQTLEGGTVGGNFGQALATGDVDGDGLVELAVGAPGNDGVVILYGQGDGELTALVTLAGNGGDFGAALALGDLDGDGYADLVVGAPDDAGAAFLFFGATGGIGDEPDAEWAGAAAGDALGTALAIVGDVNGDGFDDLVVGAPGADASLGEEGAVYAFHGSASGPSATADWSYFGSAASEGRGTQLAGGDFDGDGYTDLVLGAEEVESDHLLLFSGSAAGLSASPDYASGWFDGTMSAQVAMGADADGDGVDDLPYAAAMDGSGYGCDAPTVFREAGVYFGALGTGEAVTSPMDGATGVGFVGDLDGNGYLDLAVAFADGAGAVSVRLLGPDADGDGYSPDFPGAFADCDDTDASAYPGALETDGDGLDSDCDGEDDRPATTRSISCPSFTTPEEARPFADDPDAAVGGPLAAADEVLASLYAAACGTEEEGIDEDGAEVLLRDYDCDVDEDGLDADGWQETEGLNRSGEGTETGSCATSDTRESTTVASVDLSTAGASGATSAQLRRASTSVESTDSRTSRGEAESGWGTLGWEDGSTSTWYGRSSTDSGYDIDWCKEVEQSYHFEHGSCAIDVGYESDPCRETESWSVTDGTHVLTVEALTESVCEGVGYWPAVSVATLDGVVSLVDSDDWSPLVDPADDLDGDGWSSFYGDCDDTDASIHPCAEEPGGDGVDHDCDGLTSSDMDGDGWTDTAGDCDDADAGVYPGASEQCNGRDDDCDGDIDEGATVTLYADEDGDGYGASDDPGVPGCLGDEGVTNHTDCDDTDASVHPGAEDATADGIDQDCDGVDGPPSDTGVADTDSAAPEDTAAEDTAAKDSGQTRGEKPGEKDGHSPACGSLALLLVLPALLGLGPRRKSKVAQSRPPSTIPNAGESG